MAHGPSVWFGPQPRLARQWWEDFAACSSSGLDVFFTERQHEEAEAKAICQQCPVQRECLQFALSLGAALHGTWGATTRRERAKMRRRKASR
jgi:WhiB family redox-sensing transcriptional regulator